MPITVPCVKCKSRFQVPSKLAGTTVRCKQCGCAIRLPSPEKIQAKKQAAKAGATSSGSPKRGTKVKPAPSPATAGQKPAGGMFEESFELMNFDEPPRGGNAAASNAPAPSIEPTVLSCSHCEGLLYYDPNFANQTVACPHCGNHLIMPEL